MRIQIEPTPYVLDLAGVQCRAWNGVIDSGVGCVVFVHRVMVKQGEDQFAFDVELAELAPGERITGEELARAIVDEAN